MSGAAKLRNPALGERRLPRVCHAARVPGLSLRLFWAPLAWLVLALGAADAPARPQATTHPPINHYCPVMTAEEADANYTTVYNGQTIAFCCDKCLAKFEADPERYVARLSGELIGVAAQDKGERHGEGTSPGAPDPGTHLHQPHRPQDQSLARLARWFGRFHPASVHFPIAMILSAALAEVLLIVTQRTFYVGASRFCLWIGSLGAVIAGTLGWLFAGFSPGEDHWTLALHRWFGTATAFGSVPLLWFGERAAQGGAGARRTFRVGLFSVALLVAATGFLGGALVYGLDHYAW